MELLWDVFFWLIPIWTFVLIPFATFYYESDDGLLLYPDGEKQSRIKQAVCWTLVTVLVMGSIFGAAFVLANETSIPVNQYETKSIGSAFDQARKPIFSSDASSVDFTANLLQNMTEADQSFAQGQGAKTEEVISMRVGLSTFFAGLMAWLGWFLFAIFGGIGMSALPMDLIYAYKNRPRHMDAAEFAEAQMSLRGRVNELVGIGEMIKVEREGKQENSGSKNPFNKAARSERQAMNEFKQTVFLLEQDVEDFQACTTDYENTNPLVPYLCVIAGVFSAIISLFWIVQIGIYVLPNPPLSMFLNTYFSWFDEVLNFALFGVISVSIFTVYMLLAAMKGCFKFGLRFACIQLHPMIIGKTYMSSFLFNIGLLLLCALPVVQFCSTAFSTYARNSTIFQIFGVQISNLAFFGWWWTNDIFIYVFLALTLLSAIYLCCKPRDGPPSAEELRDRLRSRAA
jgi:LMBR1 domain-containing protein 1